MFVVSRSPDFQVLRFPDFQVLRFPENLPGPGLAQPELVPGWAWAFGQVGPQLDDGRRMLQRDRREVIPLLPKQVLN